ncbi:MAG: LLM class flavin-dependent oxidoreductase [Caulobacteraceae bacterium]|nr:LLM class flavin-dependent oxidoreductase [Caulobacteraceae bacterium]
MRFGLFGGALAAGGASSDSQNYGKFIDYVCEADALGFESIYVVEHHFTGLGQVSATLNLLSYMAARTNRIRLGTGVTVLPWHNPVLLAEQIGTLDILSGGRADIGIGKGYRPIEFNGFNIDQSQAAERYEEALTLILKSLTATERFSHSGKYWTFNDIVVEPAPLQNLTRRFGSEREAHPASRRRLPEGLSCCSTCGPTRRRSVSAFRYSGMLANARAEFGMRATSARRARLTSRTAGKPAQRLSASAPIWCIRPAL